jgi:hypothetical protein
MDMPEGKLPQPKAEVCEAALWYVRWAGRHPPTEEMHEFRSWLRRSPENVAAVLQLATMDRQAIPQRMLDRVLRLDPAGPLASSKRALSLTYYKHIKRQYLYPKIGLLTVAVGGVAGWMFLDDVRPLKIAAVAVVCFLLLLVREAVLRFRVENGYFGGTESEVRDFVKFIIGRRGDIDFTDQGGKRRPSLVPEPPATSSDTVVATGPEGALSE